LGLFFIKRPRSLGAFNGLEETCSLGSVKLLLLLLFISLSCILAIFHSARYKMPKFKTAFIRDKTDYSITDVGECITEQSHAQACDINNIMARPDLEELLIAPSPVFADVSDVIDYHNVMNILTDAIAEFAKMDPKIRERFNNDHMELIDFLSKPENEEEAQALGLVISLKTPESLLKTDEPDEGDIKTKEENKDED
jgi:phage internal scaffolding protein